MKKRIFVYVFLFICVCYVGVIIGTQLGTQGYKKQQQQYNEKEKIIEGIIDDLKSEDDTYIFEINEKEYNLEKYINMYYDFEELEDIYNKIEINDTIKIYKSKEEIFINGNARRDYQFVIKCNDEIIYNGFGSLKLEDHIYRCITGCIITLTLGYIIFLYYSEQCIIDYFEDYSYNRKKKKEQKEQEKEQKIKNLQKKINKLEKEKNKAFKCQYCGTKNVDKAKYCYNCGLEF